MILHENKKNVDTNMTGAGAFSIKASAKAFKILSDGLYSDKIRAVVRELSCNALDSHTAAGCPEKPIQVHLPSLFEPYFSVQDFGLGLSKESIMNLYTTYFESTKADSNDQIGALGLGSKSPFSYTDSFTVTSVFDGVKSMYSAYIGSNGEPCIQPLSDEETTDDNGVTVSFAVKKEDTDKFKSRAELVYRPFNVKPVVVGVDTFEIEDRGVVKYSGNGWKIYESSYYNRDQYVVQGNIEYPLDSNNIDCENDKQKFILSQNCDIEFKLGELDIAASRESIGYDEITRENIRARLEEVYNELVEVVNADIGNSKTFWEACRKSKILQENFYYSSMLTDGLVFNGEPIKHNFSIDDNEIVGYYHNYRTQTKVGRNVFKRSISTDNDFIFVLNDMKSKNKGISRVRAWVAENNGSYCLVVNDKSIFDILGSPEYKLASEFEDKSIATVNKKSPTGKHFKEYYHSGSVCWQWDNLYQSFEDVAGSVETKIYYMPIKSKEAPYGDMYGLVHAAIYLGLVDTTRYITGIKESFIGTKKFNELAETVEFIRLDEAVNNIIDDIKDNYMFKNILEDVLLHTVKVRKSSPIIKDIIKILKKDIDILLPGVAKDIVSSYNHDNNVIHATKMCEVTARFFNNYIKVDVTKFDDETKLQKAYPLIKMLDRWEINHDEDKALVNYINMIELQS